jgi:hypothetical protein
VSVAPHPSTVDCCFCKACFTKGCTTCSSLLQSIDAGHSQLTRARHHTTRQLHNIVPWRMTWRGFSIGHWWTLFIALGGSTSYMSTISLFPMDDNARRNEIDPILSPTVELNVTPTHIP